MILMLALPFTFLGKMLQYFASIHSLEFTVLKNNTAIKPQWSKNYSTALVQNYIIQVHGIPQSQVIL